MGQQVLVGDIGGTHARFALATDARGGLQLEYFQKLHGNDYPAFRDAVATYLSMLDTKPSHALLAVAGVVTGGEVQMTNRDWTVSPARLKETFAFEAVELVNDFAAMARSIPELEPEIFQPIYAGQAIPAAPVLVAGAGTGLGVATLLPEAGNRWRVVSGEGGHTAYSARTDIEFELFGLLHAEYGYVSNELVCSGMGMEPLHRGLCHLAGTAYEVLDPQSVLDRAEAGDTICLDVCRIRARAIMGAAGDAALTNATWGGVVLAGGVTQRLYPYLLEPESLERFQQRGPRTKIMSSIPIRMMIEEKAPLLGAAALFFDH